LGVIALPLRRTRVKGRLGKCAFTFFSFSNGKYALRFGGNVHFTVTDPL
jgi:hypothetical protein